MPSLIERLILLCLLTSPPGFGADRKETAACLAAFSDAFYSKLYQPSNCYENVIRLVKRFKRRGIPFDAKRARIVYIFTPGRRVQGLATRTGPDSWYFHTVLEYEGRVYDLDFTDAPKGVTRAKFLDKMFLGSGEARERLLDEIRVRPIPANEYLRDYGKIIGPHYRGYRFYWNDEDVEALYPSMPVREYRNP